MSCRPLPHHLAAADRHRQALAPAPLGERREALIPPPTPAQVDVGRMQGARDRLSSSKDSVHAPVAKTWRLHSQGLGLPSFILMVPGGKPAGAGLEMGRSRRGVSAPVFMLRFCPPSGRGPGGFPLGLNPPISSVKWSEWGDDGAASLLG